MENFYYTSSFVRRIIMHDKPAAILEISGYNACFGRLFADCQKRSGLKNTIIDRIFLTSENINPDNIYNETYSSDYINKTDSLKIYDMIFIAHLPENSPVEDTIFLTKKLLNKVSKQILIMTPEYPYDLSKDTGVSDIREYHPSVFQGFTFNHWMLNSVEGNYQFYNIYCNPDYIPLDDDISPVDKIFGITKREDYNYA